MHVGVRQEYGDGTSRVPLLCEQSVFGGVSQAASTAHRAVAHSVAPESGYPCPDQVLPKSGGMPTAVRVGMFDQIIRIRYIHTLLIVKNRTVPLNMRCTPPGPLESSRLGLMVGMAGPSVVTGGPVISGRNIFGFVVDDCPFAAYILIR